MGEVSEYPHGTFCWVDLGTTDVAGAKSFYRELLGWEMQDVPAGPDQTYTTCSLRGRAVTGLHRHTEDEGVGWSSSISVDEVDAITARAVELGAAVEVAPSEIPGVARVSAIRDPGGAQVVLWEPRGHPGAGIVNEVGTWTWNEVVTADLDRAAGFYAELLGWRIEAVPGPIRRVSFTTDELLVAGGHAPVPGEAEAPRWDVSFRVADVDASTALAQRLGASVLLPAMDIPIGRFAIVADPAGAPFTVTAFAGPVRGVDGS